MSFFDEDDVRPPRKNVRPKDRAIFGQIFFLTIFVIFVVAMVVFLFLSQWGPALGCLVLAILTSAVQAMSD